MTKKTENEENENDNKFKYLSNLDNLIILHKDIKDTYLYQGFMNTSKLHQFVNVILKNILFDNTETNYDTDDDDLNNFSFY